jgi:hypothetical protein
MGESMSEIIGTAADYAQLRTLIDSRRKSLGLTMLDLDDLAGVQSGYSSKIICGSKHFGNMSLGSILGALGIELAAVRSAPPHEKTASGSNDSMDNYKIVRKKLGAKGGRAYANNTSAEERRKSARHAAKVRWRRWREVKAVKDAKEKRLAKANRAGAEG